MNAVPQTILSYHLETNLNELNPPDQTHTMIKEASINTQHSTTQRIPSIDLLKGLVMIIMALDHVRDYFHDEAFLFGPTDPENTYLGLFLTRWITHFCAPAFSFTAGISAYFAGRKKSKSELSLFLVKRGVWLIFIELTLVNFAWYFDLGFGTVSLLVLWSLGMSMMVLAVLVHFPLKYILLFSLVLIFGHNLLDLIPIQKSILWSMVHEFGFYGLENGKILFVGYPIIPWVGIMSLGYFLGTWYTSNTPPKVRQWNLKVVGFLGTIGFVMVRWMNGYGNLHPWEYFDSIPKTLYSFLDPAKYPPSLAYLLMTLGPIFLFLGFSEHIRGKLVGVIRTFGTVPFFYYIIHLYLIHTLGLFLAWATNFGWESMLIKGWVTESAKLDGYGLGLYQVYLVWLGVLLTLYPLCLKFSTYKMQNKNKTWLGYF